MRGIVLVAVVLVSAVTAGAADREAASSPRRVVLVELYTSQGCNMCPDAEKYLGALAAKHPKMVPIAFHVDYFNTPWKDPFSDPLHSQRQMAYNNLYTKPKPAEYGLYYTPMLMVDGEQSVNGRDPKAADEAVRRALAKPPGVSLKLTLKDPSEKTAGSDASRTLKVEATAKAAEVDGREVLLCAVLTEDGVSTKVPSGENGGKTLANRFPARSTKYEFVKLDRKVPAASSFAFKAEPGSDASRLRLVVFAQDRKTGAVYQAVDMPWAEAVAADRPGR